MTEKPSPEQLQMLTVAGLHLGAALGTVVAVAMHLKQDKAAVRAEWLKQAAEMFDDTMAGFSDG